MIAIEETIGSECDLADRVAQLEKCVADLMEWVEEIASDFLDRREEVTA